MKTEVDDDRQEMLFRIFEAAQGLERRAVRIIARGSYNVHATAELRAQAAGIISEIDALESEANPA